MNPPLYRVTGVGADGNRRIVRTNQGPAFRLDLDHAKRTVVGYNAYHYSRRWGLTDLRIEQAYPDWKPVDD